MGFHQHVHQVEALAEPLRDGRADELVRVGARKAAGALDDVGRPGETLLGQERRRDAALRRVRRLDAFSRRAGVIELRDPARIAAGKPDRLDDARSPVSRWARE